MATTGPICSQCSDEADVLTLLSGTCPERRSPAVKISYMWSRLYVNAILETDSGKLPLRIREAEWAMQQRSSSTLPIDGAERELMTGARARLRSLRTERLAKTA